MRFHGFTVPSLIDFHGRIALVAFAAGCSFRCPACHAREIAESDGPMDGAQVLALDPASGHLEVEAADSLRSVIAERLHKLGYPEQGSVEGIAAMAASAKKPIKWRKLTVRFLITEFEKKN